MKLYSISNMDGEVFVRAKSPEEALDKLLLIAHSNDYVFKTDDWKYDRYYTKKAHKYDIKDASED